MHRHNIAYRHQDGEIEGFTGVGLSKSAAKTDAFQCVKYKVEGILNETFEEDRVIESDEDLPVEEKRKVRKDWERTRHA